MPAGRLGGVTVQPRPDRFTPPAGPNAMTADAPDTTSDTATNPARADADVDVDAVTLFEDVPLTEDEAGYVEAARAANTMRGYRSDWREFTSWCTGKGLESLPAAPATITGYLTDLAHAGSKAGAMSRRLSALKLAHQLRNLPDPTRNARVVDACPSTKV